MKLLLIVSLTAILFELFSRYYCLFGCPFSIRLLHAAGFLTKSELSNGKH